MINYKLTISGDSFRFKVFVFIFYILIFIFGLILESNKRDDFHLSSITPKEGGNQILLRGEFPEGKTINELAAPPLDKNGGTETSLWVRIIGFTEDNSVSPSLLSELLKLNEKAERLERLLLENGITDKKAIVCLLATAYHESGFNSSVVYKERNGSVSRGVFQFNSRGLGRNVSAKNLHSKEYQVKHLVSMKSFRQWYGEVKSKNWSIQTAMTELTRRIIRCAPKHYAARIKTATKWWQEVKQ